MRTRLIVCLIVTSGLAACAEPKPWAGWESGAQPTGAAVASDQTGYKDYTPRPAIESAPLDPAAAAGTYTPPPGDNPYAAADAANAGMGTVSSTGAPTPLHAGPFAVETQAPIAYTGAPIAQRTLPLALTGTGVAR